ncbi:MAG TPA: hypothetical protein PLA61_00595 [Ferruginibacter sp.]|nr:hypothetical protein [Ferruginibacter sp.]
MNLRHTSAFLPVACLLLFIASCRNETEQLLTRKWDCVKVENLELSDGMHQNPEDSLNTARTIAVLETLSWTFKSNHEYECAAAGRVLTQGTYGLAEDGKMLICTPSTRNNINRYIITVLNENELVLNSGFPPLVLHFKAH